MGCIEAKLKNNWGGQYGNFAGIWMCLIPRWDCEQAPEILNRTWEARVYVTRGESICHQRGVSSSLPTFLKGAILKSIYKANIVNVCMLISWTVHLNIGGNSNNEINPSDSMTKLTQLTASTPFSFFVTRKLLIHLINNFFLDE